MRSSRENAAKTAQKRTFKNCRILVDQVRKNEHAADRSTHRDERGWREPG
jgi:hypothetical protein